jgi:hypothetical protein
LTSARQSETLRLPKPVQAGVTMRIRIAALLAAFACASSLPVAEATAQTAPSIRSQQAQLPAATDTSAQRRLRRPPTRLRVYPNDPGPDGVYPRYYPGRNAVRDCTATYVQEYRPSGTVIVPHMNCYWRRG